MFLPSTRCASLFVRIYVYFDFLLDRDVVVAVRFIPVTANGIKCNGEYVSIFCEGANRINRATPFYWVVGIRIREGSITRTVCRTVVRGRIRPSVSACFLYYFFWFLISEVFMLTRRDFFCFFKGDQIRARIFIVKCTNTIGLVQTRAVLLSKVFINGAFNANRLVRATVKA